MLDGVEWCSLNLRLLRVSDAQQPSCFRELERECINESERWRRVLWETLAQIKSGRLCQTESLRVSATVRANEVLYDVRICTYVKRKRDCVRESARVNVTVCEREQRSV